MSWEPGRLTLQKFFTGELRGEEVEKIKSHIEGCSHCSSYIDELEAEQKRFLNLHPFEQLEPKRSETKSRFSIPDLFAAKGHPLYALSAILLLTLVSIPLLILTMGGNDEEMFRYRGSSQLQFFYDRAGVISRGSLSQEFMAGDRIQILYEYSGFSHVSLFSIDNLGNIYFYQPDQGDSYPSVPADTGNHNYFPSSIILDDKGRGELIVLLHSNRMVKTEELRSWIKGHSGYVKADLSLLERELKNNPLFGQGAVYTMLINKQEM
ncbi:hypothetical protein CHISP_0112 [Chitinispirillum alkaliphilum]|nr:hypothetical protein CHISP_0112 [Chitinispirillum alkaliphilum]